MGDSDKPKDYAYSTAERTDLVEAIWRNLSVKSTTLVGFDFSSLVILEHLRRRLERSERSEPAGDPDIRGVFIFNGGLFTDGHSHPWFTTPLLRRLPPRAEGLTGRSFTLFKMMASDRLGQQFVVENRPGANSNLATKAVANARPDGYTFLLATSSNTINATLYEKLNFNFIRDLDPVGSIVEGPHIMEVNPSFPAKTVSDFISYAKAILIPVIILNNSPVR
jgi:pimeloyl-ACP methyl ester carboxylesterase